MPIEKLQKIIRGELKQNHNLAPYTSWRIGGPAKYFFQPADVEDLATFLHQLPAAEPIVWLGGGSNVLIPDEGIAATVINVHNRLNKLIQLDDFTIRAEAGVGCARLVQHCVKLGMSDSAFLVGIPGTIGGALAMNAGAHGDAIWNYVLAVETINRAGRVSFRSANEFRAEYRKINGLGQDEWFLAGHFLFTKADKSEARKIMRELLAKRKKSQPLNVFTCGSVFKNPPNDYAARLIETCGFKGKGIGGAKVSEKHANFIMNTGNATAKDIKALMQLIVEHVDQKFAIKLESEVRMF